MPGDTDPRALAEEAMRLDAIWPLGAVYPGDSTGRDMWLAGARSLLAALARALLAALSDNARTRTLLASAVYRWVDGRYECSWCGVASGAPHANDCQYAAALTPETKP